MCCLLLIVRVPCSYLVSFLFCFVFFFVSFLVSSSRILTFFWGVTGYLLCFVSFSLGFACLSFLALFYSTFSYFLSSCILFSVAGYFLLPLASLCSFFSPAIFTYFTNSSSFPSASVHNHIPHIPVFSLIPHSSSLPLAYHPATSVPSAPEDVKTHPLPPSPLCSSHPAPPRLSPASFRPPSRSSR